MNKKLSILEPEKTKEELQQEHLYSGDYVSFSKHFGTSLRGHQYTRTYGVAIDFFDVQKDKTSKEQFEAEVTIRKLHGLYTTKGGHQIKTP
ncbi:hypothetical protein [Tenacibaculum sp. SDUM215027]|uniref:hypothetical protein n=1 Tax=Tenacibaculum sp. SDUM215027 TaxID=3422596 RepID=UPI003D31CE33